MISTTSHQSYTIILPSLRPRSFFAEPIAVDPKQKLQSPHVRNGIDNDRRAAPKTRSHFDFTNTTAKNVIKTSRLIRQTRATRQQRVTFAR